MNFFYIKNGLIYGLYDFVINFIPEYFITDASIILSSSSYASRKKFFSEAMNYNHNLNNQNYLIFGVLFNNKLIAFLEAHQIFEEVELEFIGVHCDYRKQGIAKQIIQIFEYNIQQLGAIRILLEVGEQNLKALNLYKTLNYKQYGIRKKYYLNGDHAILMEKQILKDLI